MKMYEEWAYITPADFWLYQNITVSACMLAGTILGISLQRWYFEFKLRKAYTNAKLYESMKDYFREKGYLFEKKFNL